MIKALPTAACASLFVCGAAAAADLPPRFAPVLSMPAPEFTWTGFYAGANLGALINDSNVRTAPAGTLVAPAPNFVPGIEQYGRNYPIRDTSLAGGGQIGFNSQFGPANLFVVGLEADFQGTGVNDRTGAFQVGTEPPRPGNLTTTMRQQIDYFGTARARFGVAYDRVFLYATGGYAYGEVRTDASFAFAGPFFTGAQFAATEKGLRTGYAVGGGIEYALPTASFLNFFDSRAVTLKAEYLYVGLEDKSGVTARTAAGGSSVSTDAFAYRSAADFHLARMGVNYKF